VDVIPSFLGRRSNEYYDGDMFDNIRLRAGEVQEIVYPDDERNLSGRFTEYRVLVQHRANGTAVTKMYDHCLLANFLGGLADKVHYTLRPEPSDADSQKNGVGKGSKVLLLCVNGESDNAVILSGMRDGADQTDAQSKAKDLGHHFYFNFNGISFFVDKDGQAVFTYNGKTDIDGKTNSDVDSKAVGTTLKFTNDGNAQFADKDAKNALTIDHANKKVTIAREEKFEIGNANEAFVLGTTYRKAEHKLNNKLKDQLDTLNQQLIQVTRALQTCKTLPTIISGLALAATAIQQCAQAVSQMKSAISDFESDDSKYISTKNFGD